MSNDLLTERLLLFIIGQLVIANTDRLHEHQQLESTAELVTAFANEIRQRMDRNSVSLLDLSPQGKVS